MALTYHVEHKVITCVCGKLITGEHTCVIQISKIKVVVCGYTPPRCGRSGNGCGFCVDKEVERIYEDQWERDRCGNCRCAICGCASDASLPKICECTAFIDYDGKTKCKGCRKIWVKDDLYSGECGKCGYDGD